MSDGELQDLTQDAIDRAVRSGAEAGLQVAVLRHGRLVVDVCAGRSDANHTDAVGADTLFWAASTAKGVAAAVAHVLVERGELDDDLRAVDVWPEFGTRGKELVTLRHVLLHTAGVPAPPYDTTVEQLCDWDHMCAALADAEPWWVPGTRFGYHALTFGFLLGEVVRRATGRSLPEWLRELVTGPLGVEDDVHFGVPEALLGRVARQHPPRGTPPDPPAPGSGPDRAVPPGVRPDAAFANRPEIVHADIISMGTMTARGAATVYAGLLGHVPGVGLVSPPRLREMASVTYEGPDAVMGVGTSWAFGFTPFRPGGAARPGSTFGMVGSNGSAAYADIETGVAVAVMRNRCDPDFSAITEIDRLVAEAFPPPPSSTVHEGSHDG